MFHLLKHPPMSPRHKDTPQGVEIGTVVNNRTVQPGLNGGTLQVGNPKGRGGDLRSKARRIRLEAISEKFLKSADSILVAGNPDHPKWDGVGKWATEMVEGKPNQAVQVDASIQIVVSQGLGVRVTPDEC